ncbi:50S ribosomal protein L9 [Desulfonatronospira sp.]|uniref:50S ribosomal protein L9 n=1 Tax=Desulfonatronospira sp. TaxID=1962951 RepID=UPI0025BA8914|nr:50S ribosomal protein L9 [Desulfonatronospira sp.]
MQLILRADVDNLGRLGDMVKVKPGYARNYLIPQRLAYPATKANLNIFEQERKRLQEKMDSIRREAQSLGEKLQEARVVIPVRVGEHDKLYGSVTTAMIADSLARQGIDIDKRKIVLDNPIRSLGEYEIGVKLHHDIQVDIKVSVVRHDSEQDIGQSGEES